MTERAPTVAEIAVAVADELERRGLVRKLAKAEPATERMTPERKLAARRKVRGLLRARGLR